MISCIMVHSSLIIDLDLMTIGNHEFDDGEAYLAEFFSSLNFPVVSANIDFNDAIHLKAAGVKPYSIFAKYKLALSQ